MLAIQINDTLKWNHIKGQAQLKTSARQFYKHKWPNVFVYDKKLEMYLITKSVDFTIYDEPHESDCNKLSIK